MNAVNQDGNSIQVSFPHSLDDEQALEFVKRKTDGAITLPQILSRLGVIKTPPRLVQTIFIIKGLSKPIPPIPAPYLLIPKNPNRRSFLIAAMSSNDAPIDLFFSFDFPVKVGDLIATAPYLYVGVPVNFVPFFTIPETNGTVSINDIYVWDTSGNGELYFFGYEGTLSPTGNAR